MELKQKKTKSNFRSNGESVNDGYEPLSLDSIRKKVLALCEKVPSAKIENDNDTKSIKEWALSMQAVIEEFNLLMSLVPIATYKWGGERSGAADQNLSLLSAELNSSQDNISTGVTHRLNNYLAPVVDMVVSKVTISRESGDTNKGQEVRENEYKSDVVDPEFLKLCGTILCRNATMLRHVVLANFHKVETVIRDYQKSAKKDNQQDRSFTY